MVVSMKVEALENGARGQVVRVRNVYSRKELKGKVEDEHTILVSL
jgi:flagella basal body P-ring formation protein FlgA